MEIITDRSAAASAPSGNSNGSSNHWNAPSPKRLKKSWIEALWTKLHAIYGAKWSDSYPDAITDLAKIEWAEALADLSGEQIKTGLSRCRTVLKWPPSPAEFVAEAKVSKPEAHQAYKPLPKPAPNPELTAKAMQGLRDEAKRLGRKTRCLYSPGYTEVEYQRDLAAARTEGRSLYDVDMAAMAKNGWTEQDEENWRAAGLKLGLKLGWSISRLYPRGHEPGADDA